MSSCDFCSAFHLCVPLLCSPGFGKYDLVSHAKNRCPCCGQYVQPETVGFSGCKYKFFGIKRQ